ncbi:MAG: hemolysin family protein [Actinomycetota bacterium]|nr:hemolysin family protein [Actinomycetota bacterium]MEC7666677.1 hemolysin family protein [Actinomycetota bacterium]MEC8485648.1 hemolysin family protein [Actinomycetota bacterium]MEC9224750.1 hemolysin family protein [Actinomycetota bacterium]MEE3068226.1 hemolysin family protein [Actinomycetota bacterium]
MNGANLVMLLVIIVLLFALIFLAIAEMGLSKMTKPRAAAITENKPRIEPSLTALVDNPEGWINPLLLMVNVCQTVQATLTGIVAGNLFGGVGVAVGVTLNVIVFFVLAEAVPKTYAVLNPDRAAMIAARPVRALTAFPPLRMISAGLIGLTNVLVKGRGLESGPFVSEQEFLGIVEAAAQDEVIEHEERELIESIIEFGDTVAREVMVPRPDMVMVANTATITDALNLGIAHGFSRLPVSGSDEDDIVGLAFTKDLMRAEREGRGELPVLDLARDVTFIPENKPVARLMREMQDSKFHIAIVADEYGDIAGLVTLEDCLEELVGEIVDEYDAEEHDIERFDDGTLLVDGGLNIGDVADELGIDIPNEDFDSVGGFVFSALERVPEPGDAIDFEGFAFLVESVEGRRVRRVRIAPAPQDGGDDSAAEASSD